MSDFPYTREQIRAVHVAMPGGNEPYTGYEILVALHRAGIKVTFAEPPRYQVREEHDNAVVIDFGRDHEPIVAEFDTSWHPYAERAAEFEAATLNDIDAALSEPVPDGEGRTLDDWRTDLEVDAGCGGCRFYAPPSYSGDKGRCHVDPPVAINASLAFFPVVKPTDWCSRREATA